MRGTGRLYETDYFISFGNLNPFLFFPFQVYLVLLNLRKKLPLSEFFELINHRPLACALLEKYCKEQDPPLLQNYYYQDDRRIDSANSLFWVALKEQ